ncbi:MAG TPA: hypothetical protein VMO17_22960 [Terriglobia bacterium]|nr:hypothetical protein [Terriglobia bacterium]
MRADRVEISWDAAQAKWLVRIESGEEAIRRHCQLPMNADEAKLRSAVEQTVRDEGYDFEQARIVIRR